ERTINENTQNEVESKAIKAIAINPNCETRDLDKKFLECLNWENIGVVPELEVDDM
ncbi:6407_t:CDS:1, partial [Racocetra fulgida]